MEALRCGVCSETYEVGTHDPLVLPCGHTFCRECIGSISKTNRVECPACRRSHNVLGVDFLPKNYAVLSISSPKTETEFCLVHGDPLRFWCVDCKGQICGICMFDGHPRNDHRVVRTKTLMDEKKEALQAEANRLVFLTRAETASHEKCYSRYEKKLLRLLKTNNDMCNLHDQVKTLLMEAMQSTDVSNLIDCESRMMRLQATTQKVITSSGLLCLNRHNNVDDRDTESVRKGYDVTIKTVDDVTKMLHLGLRCLNGGEGFLQWDRDRLLYYACQSDRSPNSSNIQMIAAVTPLEGSENTEVFLDLSAGDTSLGRVYIRLYKKLRRAHHFLALCIGTFGPSFRKSNFVAVKRRNEPEESVAGGDYLTQEGQVTSRALMTDLEWGGQYAGERREGLVVGSSGGSTDEDARFGISTSKNASGECQCPFGEVVEGLEVVRKTLTLERISQVMIKECGMVVLNHHSW